MITLSYEFVETLTRFEEDEMVMQKPKMCYHRAQISKLTRSSHLYIYIYINNRFGNSNDSKCVRMSEVVQFVTQEHTTNVRIFSSLDILHHCLYSLG